MNRYVILCLVLLALSSCDFLQRNFYSTYTVKNESNCTLDLVYYFTKNDLINGVDTIKIEKDSSYIIYENTGEGAHSDMEFIWADSMKVIFDKQKFINYYGRSVLEDTIFTEIRSPMNRTFYDRTVERKHGSDYTYTITEEDYESAAFIVKEKMTVSD